MAEIECVLAVAADLGEGPLWHPDEGVLYWLDIPKQRLYRWRPGDEQPRVRNLGETVGSIAFRQAGGLILAAEHDFAYADANGRVEQRIAAPGANREGARFNDGKVDRAGRFWAGTLDSSRSTDNHLYRLDADGAVHVMERSVQVSNGIGWSPDNRTMYYVDSPQRAIYAYDFDLASGSISNRRAFVHTPGSPDVPDGLTVDSEGYVWCAWWDGWRVVRYAPDGSVEREISVPVQRPTSCMFGGANLDELYITSARVGLSEDELNRQLFAGDLFRLRAGVRGLPEPRFAG